MKLFLSVMAAFVCVMSGTVVAKPRLSPSETVQSYDDYGSWLVACDNTLFCLAKGFEGSDQGIEMRIERQAGAEGQLTASISATHPFSLADIMIDGKPANLPIGSWQLESVEGETSATSDDLFSIRAFVRRLRDGANVTVGNSAIPLDGFTKAVSRIDERQSRSGGVTALLRVGSRAAASVPGPRPIPTVPYHPIKERLEAGEDARLIALARPSQKEAFDKEGCEPGLSSPDPEAHALDNRRALILIPCLQGAYQTSMLSFIIKRDSGSALRFIPPTPYIGNDEGQPEAAVLSEANFDPVTGTLSMAIKGRAASDCGVSGSWIWNGRTFRLSELTLQKTCGGIAPGDWPTLYRSTR